MSGLVDGATERKQTHSRNSGSACVPHLMQPPSTPSCCAYCQRMGERKSSHLPRPHHLPRACISPVWGFPSCPLLESVSQTEVDVLQLSSMPTDSSWLQLSWCRARANEPSWVAAHVSSGSVLWEPSLCSPSQRSLSLLCCPQRRGLSAWKGHTVLDLKSSEVDPTAFKNPVSRGLSHPGTCFTQV